MATQPKSAARLVRAVAHAAGLSQRSDPELLACFLSGRDEVAFEAIVRRHGAAVLSACRQILRDEADVEDAFQATFIALYQQAAAVKEPAALAGWLFRVARRAAGAAHREAARRKSREQQAARAEAAPVGTDLSWREACAVLHEELDRLPDSLRLPLIHCYLEGLSRDEAAQRRLFRRIDKCLYSMCAK